MKKLALILLFTALILMLCSCTSISYVYSNSNRYSSGEACITQRVEEIDINWTEGSVTVAYHNGDDILLSETASRNLKRNTELHWYVDGHKLYIQYAASGVRIPSNLNKKLTVLLPEDLRLDEVNISVASAKIEVDGIDADQFHLQSASGKISLKQVNHSDAIVLETASGAVSVTAENTDKLSITSVSGKVTADVLQADEVKVTATSGSVKLQFSDVPDSIDASNVSGGVTICLPESAGFKAKLKSVSGTVRCQQDAQRSGNNTYTYGDGQCQISVDTVSGSLSIEKSAEK